MMVRSKRGAMKVELQASLDEMKKKQKEAEA